MKLQKNIVEKNIDEKKEYFDWYVLNDSKTYYDIYDDILEKEIKRIVESVSDEFFDYDEVDIDYEENIAVERFLKNIGKDFLSGIKKITEININGYEKNISLTKAELDKLNNSKEIIQKRIEQLKKDLLNVKDGTLIEKILNVKDIARNLKTNRNIKKEEEILELKNDNILKLENNIKQEQINIDDIKYNKHVS